MLTGLTHDKDGQRIGRSIKLLKVGIGRPKGKAIHVYIAPSGKWMVEIGAGKQKAEHKFDSMAEARAFYDKARQTAPDSPYPSKLPYFTFLRIGIDGDYQPDWDAIEQHGPMPRSIKIVFTKEEPLDQAYEWWTAASLQCKGDGINANRRIELAKSPEEKESAATAAKRGQSTFPIVNGCYAMGCPYARGEKPACKPHSRLNFQLARTPVIGGTCAYDTTGFKSGGDLDTCLNELREITGRGDPTQGTVRGILLDLMVRPYKTAKGTQFAVSFGRRDVGARDLFRKVIEESDSFSAIAGAPMKQLAAPEEALPEEEQAKLLTAEFYPAEEEEDEEPTEPEKPQTFAPPKRKDPSPTVSPTSPTVSPTSPTVSPTSPTVSPTSPTVSPTLAQDFANAGEVEKEEVPAAVLAQLNTDIANFKAATRPARLRAFDVVAAKLIELGLPHAYNETMQRHGAMLPTDFRTLGAAVECFREMWLLAWKTEQTHAASDVWPEGRE